ncbi:cGMP-dependent protein kinase, isozyme 2 forms cD4/T1/T3A/T3B-like [Agrilus planipennis]|uniref:cGMP-dependent protein kinase, isozyme 2 forms cD4/T1/T3A/T3B-like n=1 Tax=Agrilus planipennis TaxID=224129 RepID=A0A1W4WP09_AGRPL|nr:cGMP-dependent protein kinase, isozyme 2 forms cD4/T1/T3A/T3B-like [Agrilus planipennis]XP_018321777.1 cGMP-dependent protein kinase, isozyme 2 forms cD4/T1/T3A/T3B-like [Agrilus planipennis]XP_018321778.1 cGMP-dependent protein kinase, isozyme 2 forms cD4/T1/T3A/T3B-like [Agrilus planipennis]XP_025836037.1 cGMP-dependent protein kinase, isozyme 2 forms cD4/T1/T3A/T3B-like [Agrilus planipennis]
MRICFGPFCFSSSRLQNADEDGAAEHGGGSDGRQHAFAQRQVPLATIVAVNGNAATVANMGSASVQQLQGLLQAKEEKIRQLETLLRSREEEILDLKSHLDKFQSVFPFHLNAVSPKHKALNNNVSVRPRKQRAGISAEPQTEASLQQLAKQTFQTYDKDER